MRMIPAESRNLLSRSRRPKTGSSTSLGMTGMGASSVRLNLLRKFGARNQHLLSAFQILQGENISVDFVLTHNQDEARTQLASRLKRFLQTKSFVTQIGDNIVAA